MMVLHTHTHVLRRAANHSRFCTDGGIDVTVLVVIERGFILALLFTHKQLGEEKFVDSKRTYMQTEEVMDA